MDYSPPGCSVRGISQASILDWVAISFPGDASWPRDPTLVSGIGRWILSHWATWEAQNVWTGPNVPHKVWIWKARQEADREPYHKVQRAAGVGIMFNGCLPSSPRVPGQLRTHFARSSFLLDVLWQHLVEQRKNCTAPWHEMLLLLISSLPKALQRQRLTAGAGRGPIRGPASRLPARLYSVHFYCFQAENTHCCTGKSSLAGTRK